PDSFSGEDMAELHVHGGLAVAQKLVAVLQAFESCRPAEAGEFSKRAFYNGRLDLAEIEGLADLIDAETEHQRRQALRQAGGDLSRAVNRWRDQLVRALAFLEAVLDFPEDDDIGERDLAAQVTKEVAAVSREIARFLEDNSTGERLREGVRVVIAGPPNSGKSTLLNALARRDVAIVSPVAGTTRDVLEVHLDLDGTPVTLIDTAGLRESDEDIEREGIRRANKEIEAADIVVELRDASVDRPAQKNDSPAKPNTVQVASKSDLLLSLSDPADRNMAPIAENVSRETRLSVHTGQGMEELLTRVGALARELCGSGQSLISRARHRQALQTCQVALDRFSDDQDAPFELRAEELRIAVHALGRITGRVDVEDLLDVIFRDFCIGK
ncbi:MAG: tRNA uridine-5-carboxymethylaminomethyl(34) synthesis GTPase MnmE, partial [Fimbriimonadaceae bacterium]|nr:tRNA uridine-5-carboxymethylaminomethyl(34) synthesis GTPase MnmE [Alphaproteobacteria bacterium]